MTKELAIKLLQGEVLGTTEQTHEAVKMAIEALNKVPSAEKTGTWLMTEGYPHKVYCSECYATLIPNVEWFKTYNIASNYCPNCGSRMEA